MKIGLIGSNYTRQRVRSMINSDNMFLELIDYPTAVSRMPDLLEEIQNNLDAILFTGHRVYNCACRFNSARIPWAFLKRTTVSASNVLLRALTDGRDVSRITYDMHTLPSSILIELLHETIGLKLEEIQIYSYCDTARYKAYLRSADYANIYEEDASRYHMDNINAGRASICITDSPSVQERMTAGGFASYLLEVSEDTVNSTLNELRLRHQLLHSRENPAHLEAVLSLSLRLADRYGSGELAYQQIQSVYQAEISLVSFIQSIGAAMEKRSNTHYILYTSKFELETATDGLRRLEFAENLLTIPGVESISLGVGFGTTHGIARENAEKGNRLARAQNGSYYYILDRITSPAGPFVIARGEGGKDYNELLLEHISEETGVGLKTLKMLFHVQKLYGFSVITADELARMCEVSVNNMNRTINKLLAKGYMEIEGNRSYADTGRPRRLLRIKFGILG